MSYCQSQLEDDVNFVESENRILMVKPSIEKKGVLVNDEQLKSLPTYSFTPSFELSDKNLT